MLWKYLHEKFDTLLENLQVWSCTEIDHFTTKLSVIKWKLWNHTIWVKLGIYINSIQDINVLRAPFLSRSPAVPTKGNDFILCRLPAAPSFLNFTLSLKSRKVEIFVLVFLKSGSGNYKHELAMLVAQWLIWSSIFS